MKKIKINIRVSKKLYTDIVVETEGENLSEAKVNAIKRLDIFLMIFIANTKLRTFLKECLLKKTNGGKRNLLKIGKFVTPWAKTKIILSPM